MPRGLSAVTFPCSTLTMGLFADLARAGEPARIAGDIPISDKSLRRFSFIVLPPSSLEVSRPEIFLQPFVDRRASAVVHIAHLEEGVGLAAGDDEADVFGFGNDGNGHIVRRLPPGGIRLFALQRARIEPHVSQERFAIFLRRDGGILPEPLL